jgi:ribose transport system permease protein
VKSVISRPIWKATAALVVLLVVAAMLEPRILAPDVIRAMLPFVAIGGLATIGQQLVIQQRGFDLSVAGTISLSAVIVTCLPAWSPNQAGVLIGVAAALGAGALGGLANGVAVTIFQIPSLVVTIGTNAVLIGFAFSISGGIPAAASPSLVDFASRRIGGLSILLVATVLIALSVAALLSRTVIGQRYVAVGVNPATARTWALPILGYGLVTYVAAGVLYALAGIMLAGFLDVPTINAGAPYTLFTIAAVVIGGNPLGGDRCSVIASMVGVLFLCILEQLVISLGFDQSAQSIIQAAIVLAGVALPKLLGGGTLAVRA